jgi:hypothetical protein
MLNGTKIIGILFLALIAGVSCKPESCDDPVPSMSYKDLISIQDSVYRLEFNFKDCNGDVGLGQNDTLPPYNVDGDYYYNLKIDVFYRDAGQWVQYDFNGGIGLDARIVPLTEDNREEVIEGVIERYIPKFDLFGLGDTLRFRGTLIDRALNESIPAESGIVIIDNS